MFNSGEPQKVSTQPPLLNPAQTAVAGVPAHMSAYVMAARRLGVPIPPNLAGMMAPTIGLGLPVPAVAVRSVMPAARPGAATTQYSRPAFVQRNQASNFFANLYGPQNPALPTNPGATGTTPSTPAPNSNGTAVVSSKRANKSSNVASQSNSQTGPRCETLQYVAPSKLSSGLDPNSFKVPGKKCNLSEDCAICIDPLSGSMCVVTSFIRVVLSKHLRCLSLVQYVGR